MATDATGVPTSPDSIPTLNTSADAPSGLGINAMMAAIQTALNNKPSRLTATTVAGLGAGVDGQFGHLRVGSGSVTDYVPLVYDGNLAKWVSAPFPLIGGFSSWNSTDGATEETRAVFGVAGSVEVGRSALRWKTFTDAGLRLQVRVVGQIYGSLSGTPATSQACIQVAESTLSTNAATTVVTSLSIVDAAGATSGTFVTADGGWSASVAAATKDVAFIELILVSGVAQTVRFIGQVLGRWVG